jgi:sortase (surface protein transpeptidase)
MVEKFLAIAKIVEAQGMSMRVLTDVSAERYWTVVGEVEVPSLEAFMAMVPGGENAEQLGEIMKDYHELVVSGRREIYSIEG